MPTVRNGGRWRSFAGASVGTFRTADLGLNRFATRLGGVAFPVQGNITKAQGVPPTSTTMLSRYSAGSPCAARRLHRLMPVSTLIGLRGVRFPNDYNR